MTYDPKYRTKSLDSENCLHNTDNIVIVTDHYMSGYEPHVTYNNLIPDNEYCLIYIYSDAKEAIMLHKYSHTKLAYKSLSKLKKIIRFNKLVRGNYLIQTKAEEQCLLLKTVLGI